MSKSRAELVLLFDPEEADPASFPDQPMVAWSPPPVGMFTIGHVTIAFCPWCGAGLPNPHAPSMAPPAPTELCILVGADGGIQATWGGEPVDPAQIVKIMADNDDHSGD